MGNSCRSWYLDRPSWLPLYASPVGVSWPSLFRIHSPSETVFMLVSDTVVDPTGESGSSEWTAGATWTTSDWTTAVGTAPDWTSSGWEGTGWLSVVGLWGVCGRLAGLGVCWRDAGRDACCSSGIGVVLSLKLALSYINIQTSFSK